MSNQPVLPANPLPKSNFGRLVEQFIFLILLPFSAYFLLTSANTYHQYYLICLSGFPGMAIFFYTRFSKPDSRSYLLNIAQLYFTLLVFAVFWNMVYLYYIGTFNYTRDIFRAPVQTFHAPLYGLSQLPLPSFYLRSVFSVILFAGSLVFILPKLASKNRVYLLLIIEILLLVGFAFSDGWPRLLLNTVHYNTYAEGLAFFKSLPDMLSYYVATMGKMGEHNNHYPPGNLILLYIEKVWLWKGFVLSCSFSAVLITQVLVGKIAAKLNADANKQLFARLIFMISASVLIFASIDFSTLPMVFNAFAIYFYLTFLQSRKLFPLFLFSLSVIAFGFFSFTVFLLFLFLLIYSFFLSYHKLFSKTSLALVAFFTLMVPAGFYVLFYFLSGFNWLTCFLNAVNHSHSLMQTTGFDNGMRYLIRSSGNLIGFILGCGIIPFALAIIKTKIKSEKGNPIESILLFRKAFFISLFGISFSGLFYLETERVWLCFIPAMAISGIPSFDNFTQSARNLILISGIFTALILELYWCQI